MKIEFPKIFENAREGLALFNAKGEVLLHNALASELGRGRLAEVFSEWGPPPRQKGESRRLPWASDGEEGGEVEALLIPTYTSEEPLYLLVLRPVSAESGLDDAAVSGAGRPESEETVVVTARAPREILWPYWVFDSLGASEPEWRGELDAFCAAAEAAGEAFCVFALVALNGDEFRNSAIPKDVAWLRADVVKNLSRNLGEKDKILSIENPLSFWIFLSGCGRGRAALAAAQFKGSVRDCFCPGKTGRIFPDWSLGWSVFPDDGGDAGTLVRAALDGTSE